MKRPENLMPMAGILLYGQDFRADLYIPVDGNQHHEIRPVNGDFMSIAEATWERLVSTCADFGASAVLWPVYEYSIDAPLEEIREKNALLRGPLTAMPAEIVQSQFAMNKLVAQVRNGNLIVYFRNY